MKTELLEFKTETLGCSIVDTAELYGVNPWTIRMWIDRFEILERSIDTDGSLILSPRAMEQIGEIRSLIKKRMTVEDVRKYLKAKFGEY